MSHCVSVTHDAPEDTPRYSVGELAEAGGVSRRTVRFYVQRGLIDPPHGVGRGAYYDASHLARLLAVKHAQERGLPLEVIAAHGPDGSPAPEVRAHAPAPEPWSRLVLAPGVELHARAGALTPAQLVAIERALAPLLAPTPSSPTQQGEPE